MSKETRHYIGSDALGKHLSRHTTPQTRPLVAQILLTVLMASVLMGTVIAFILVNLLGWAALPALLAGLAAPLALHALFLLLGFLLAAWVGRQARLPRGAEVIDNGGLLKAWLVECWVAWRAFLVAQPFLGGQPLASSRRTRRAPVLLVHGHLCNRAIWRPFASWLAARGHPVASVNLQPIFDPLERHTERVHSELRRLLRHTGAEQAILVGHSMGGIVARAMLRDYGHAQVAHLVTIGSPHKGTWFAHFGHQANVRQMRPGSAFLRDLEAHEAENGLPPTTVALTLHDNVVTPQAAQTLPGALVIAWRGHGHIDLLYREAVYKRLLASCEASDVPAKDAKPRVKTSSKRVTAG